MSTRPGGTASPTWAVPALQSSWVAARDMEELLKQGDAQAGRSVSDCSGRLVSAGGMPVGRKSAGPSSATAAGWFLVDCAFFVAFVE